MKLSWKRGPQEGITPARLGTRGRREQFGNEREIGTSVASRVAVPTAPFTRSDVEVLTMEWDSTFSFRVSFTGGAFSGQANSQLKLNANLVTLVPELVNTVIVPATTVCADVPRLIPPGWDRVCVTTPEVWVPLPTGNWTSQRVASIAVGYSVALDSAGFRLTLSPPNFGSVTLPRLA